MYIPNPMTWNLRKTSETIRFRRMRTSRVSMRKMLNEVFTRRASLELKLNERSLRGKKARNKNCLFRFSVPCEDCVPEAVACGPDGTVIGR